MTRHQTDLNDTYDIYLHGNVFPFTKFQLTPQHGAAMINNTQYVSHSFTLSGVRARTHTHSHTAYYQPVAQCSDLLTQFHSS